MVIVHTSQTLRRKRVLALHKTSYAVLQATLGRYDEALVAAEQNMKDTQSGGLIYTRFEGLRCLAQVRLLRARAQLSDGQISSVRTELNEAERICAEAQDLVGPSESRVSQLWLGPLYLEVLLEQIKQSSSAGDEETAGIKLADAKQMIAAYEELVANCQSPRFSREAVRLRQLIDNAAQS